MLLRATTAGRATSGWVGVWVTLDADVTSSEVSSTRFEGNEKKHKNEAESKKSHENAKYLRKYLQHIHTELRT